MVGWRYCLSWTHPVGVQFTSLGWWMSLSIWLPLVLSSSLLCWFVGPVSWYESNLFPSLPLSSTSLSLSLSLDIQCWHIRPSVKRPSLYLLLYIFWLGPSIWNTVRLYDCFIRTFPTDMAYQLYVLQCSNLVCCYVPSFSSIIFFYLYLIYIYLYHIYLSTRLLIYPFTYLSISRCVIFLIGNVRNTIPFPIPFVEFEPSSQIVFVNEQG